MTMHKAAPELLNCSTAYLSADPCSLPVLQDMASWSKDGIAGLQSVVLYSLPELDGAIDTVPLGGLVGDGIYLSLERVRRLAARLRNWVNLRRLQPQVQPPCLLLWVFSMPNQQR